MKHGKIGIIIGVLFSPILALIILLICSEISGMVLTMMGYYVNKPGWEIGEVAVKKNDVTVCNKMRQTWFVIGPQSGEQERLCVFTFAEKKPDPTACELLLPSEYGLACISNLWLQATPGEGCGWNIKDDTIYQCRNWTTDRFIQSRDCKAFEKYTKQFSACIESFAERNHNLEKCAEVPDEFIRTFCETRVRAWIKYPQLRGSFYFGTLLPLESGKK